MVSGAPHCALYAGATGHAGHIVQGQQQSAVLCGSSRDMLWGCCALGLLQGAVLWGSSRAVGLGLDLSLTEELGPSAPHAAAHCMLEATYLPA